MGTINAGLSKVQADKIWVIKTDDKDSSKSRPQMKISQFPVPKSANVFNLVIKFFSSKLSPDVPKSWAFVSWLEMIFLVLRNDGSSL